MFCVNPLRAVAVVEYTGHFVVLGYSGPASLFDKYSAAFDLVGSTLRARQERESLPGHPQQQTITRQVPVLSFNRVRIP